MNASISDFLMKQGIKINGAALARVVEAASWYRGDVTDDHKRQRVDGSEYTLLRMGYAKRACADDANLCEVVEINAGGESNEQFEAIKAVFDENRFDSMYRKQLERCSAEGTVAAYWRIEEADKYDDGTVRGGRLRLNYVYADSLIPITVINDEVTEAAFVGEDTRDGVDVGTCVLCTRENGRYKYRSVIYDVEGTCLEDSEVLLGEVKPFAVMRVAQVNNLPDMDGYGLPKLSQVVPVLIALDQAWTVLMGDLDTADKLVLMNEVLCGFDNNGQPIPPNKEMKKRFIFLGEKLPEAQSLFHEVVPEIRVDVLTKIIELLLSNLSMMFGYGTRKYSFEQGQIQTATQYVGERQDMMQELNRQRAEAKQYISDLCRACVWFLNAFQGTSWNLGADIAVEFDDSYITDRQSRMEDMRNDVLNGIGGAHVVALYLKEKYNLSDEEAARWAGEAEEKEPQEEDEA